jgi:hypothetical protein
MKFAFEIAHNVAVQREHLIMEMVEATVSRAEIAFANAERVGQYNIEVELPIHMTHEHLRADYEKEVVKRFETHGYLIAYITPWKWFISCDPSLWENE